MTVPVRDNKERHVGWFFSGGYAGIIPVNYTPHEGHRHEYQYGAVALKSEHQGFGIYVQRWERLHEMHPWDLDPHMNYEPIGYRKMTEGDL